MEGSCSYQKHPWPMSEIQAILENVCPCPDPTVHWPRTLVGGGKPTPTGFSCLEPLGVMPVVSL